MYARTHTPTTPGTRVQSSQRTQHTATGRLWGVGPSLTRGMRATGEGPAVSGAWRESGGSLATRRPPSRAQASLQLAPPPQLQRGVRTSFQGGAGREGTDTGVRPHRPHTGQERGQALRSAGAVSPRAETQSRWQTGSRWRCSCCGAGTGPAGHSQRTQRRQPRAETAAESGAGTGPPGTLRGPSAGSLELRPLQRAGLAWPRRALSEDPAQAASS